MSRKRTSAKGSTLLSLHGKTLAPLTGKILLVLGARTVGVGNGTDCYAYRVLVERDGALWMQYFNTYQSGECPQYVGNGVDHRANCEPVSGLDDFMDRASGAKVPLVEVPGPFIHEGEEVRLELPPQIDPASVEGAEDAEISETDEIDESAYADADA